MYYFSGFLFPSLIFINSNRYFNNYKFDNNSSKLLDRRITFLIIPLILLPFSISTIITIYLTILIKFINQLIGSDSSLIIRLSPTNILLIISLFFILLMFNKTKFIVKKIFLIIFFIVTVFIWTNTLLNLNIEYELFNLFETMPAYFKLSNLYILNIYLIAIFDILFYVWSYISYKNNISDWSVNVPSKNFVNPILGICLFYFGILIYYFNLL